MRRNFGQMSLADGLVIQRAGRNDWLDLIDRTVDCSAAAFVLPPVYASDEGRPCYPVLSFVKLLMQWYKLSDPGLVEAVDDRLSFRRFAGPPLDEGVPDHSTIWGFRQEFERHALSEALFSEIARQLDARGLIILKGTLIDATIVEEAVKPPSADAGPVSARDPQAGWTKKNDKSRFGYSARIAVDQGPGLIRDAILTGADLHDSSAGPSLVQDDKAAVYADKDYDSRRFRDALTAGIEDRIMHKARRDHPLRRRARLRHHEAALRLPAGSLPRPRPQPLPVQFDVRRHQPASCQRLAA